MSAIEWIYKNVIRPRVFGFSNTNAELAHNWAIKQLRLLERYDILESMARRLLTYHHPMLQSNVFGVDFPNPLGLAAGFDKHLQVYRRGVPALGFGFVEIGAITRWEQEDNRRVRMLRSEAHRAIWNDMRFNNPGADKARRHFLSAIGSSAVPVGLNIGMSRTTPLEEAATDYCYTISRLWRWVDFIVLNVSSFNTPGLRKLQDPRALSELVQACERTNREMGEFVERKSIGIKISPDESDKQLADIVTVCKNHQVDFLVATNATKRRDGVAGWDVPEYGAISGRPLFRDSSWIVSELYQALQGTKTKIIGVGGISSSRQLYQMILLGASVCEVLTALPFEGADMCKRWLKDLVEYLRVDGFKSVSDAVGQQH